MNILKERFKALTIHDYIVVILCFVVLVLGLYLAIGMSVSVSKGLTLFGDSKNQSGDAEVTGPTRADISVLVLVWILVALMIVIFIYLLLFKKPTQKLKVTKEVIDNKVVDIKAQADDTKKGLSDDDFLKSLNKLENEKDHKDADKHWDSVLYRW